MTAEDFLTQTEPAVRHMFLALQVYMKLTPSPSLTPFKHKDGGFHLTCDQAKGFLEAESDAKWLDLAKATLSGAILQVAYSSIKIFSTNKVVSSSLYSFLGDIKFRNYNEKDKIVKYFVGREIHGLPLGLLIYAARVQYNHWEDGDLRNQIAMTVFDHLSEVRYHDMWNDLLYDLDWPARGPVSHHILQLELEWDTYDKYISDMRNALFL